MLDQSCVPKGWALARSWAAGGRQHQHRAGGGLPDQVCTQLPQGRAVWPGHTTPGWVTGSPGQCLTLGRVRAPGEISGEARVVEGQPLQPPLGVRAAPSAGAFLTPWPPPACPGGPRQVWVWSLCSEQPGRAAAPCVPGKLGETGWGEVGILLACPWAARLSRTLVHPHASPSREGQVGAGRHQRKARPPCPQGQSRKSGPGQEPGERTAACLQAGPGWGHSPGPH